MSLYELGYNADLEDYRKANDLSGFAVARVISEHRGRYTLKTETIELEASLSGSLIFAAQSRHDFPAVGDWLAIKLHDENKAIVQAIFPRKSTIVRDAVQKAGSQIIATNVDCALLIQAVDRDFNLNRLERYMALCNASKIEILIILSKIDLIDDERLEALKAAVAQRAKDTPLICISNESGAGYAELKAMIEPGATYCLLGSSGVGKSTLTNKLVGKELMETSHIAGNISRGRHVTSHRELLIMENGGIIIDNPGMRWVGMAESSEGIESTFDLICRLAKTCKFNDCSHQDEVGCAIRQAIDEGTLEEQEFFNFQKLERENNRVERMSVKRQTKAMRASNKREKYSKKDRWKNWKR